MFKKKPNLPPRPTCPTPNQMIEDLTIVKNDDPLFATAKAISERIEEAESLTDNEAAYRKIKRFFKSHDNLQEVMKTLNVTNNSLNEKQCDMLKMSEELKNQAIKALI